MIEALAQMSPELRAAFLAAYLAWQKRQEQLTLDLEGATK